MFDISALVQGFALGLGLFVCPGPKDLLILRLALLKQSAFQLVAAGVLSDAFLIVIGIAGVSEALSRAPALQSAALWLGVGVMSWHAIGAAKRAASGNASMPTQATPASSGRPEGSVAALLGMCFFNPVAWLDTLLVLGTVGAALRGGHQSGFAFGAVLASLVWFLALVLGARRAARWMTVAAAWRVLDAFTAIAMLGLALWVVRDLV